MNNEPFFSEYVLTPMKYLGVGFSLFLAVCFVSLSLFFGLPWIAIPGLLMFGAVVLGLRVFSETVRSTPFLRIVLNLLLAVTLLLAVLALFNPQYPEGWVKFYSTSG